ncbi:MAG: GNAT family N-acetyltransferase [Chloroflexota bacterium]
MTALALATETDCPASTDTPDAAFGATRHLISERVPFGDIDRGTWDRLAASSAWSTPFSAWAFHRAWWDAYGDNAHDETTVFTDPALPPGANAIAIFPLMHRHEVEVGDANLHTALRHGHDQDLTPVPPTATALFFGASYHADYATILAKAADLPSVAAAFVADLQQRAVTAAPDWDAVDLRRLRCSDPAVDALAAAFRRTEMESGWTLNLEREDVCPVAALPADGTLDDYFATLGKKERHEIRRKVRRAEAAGDVALVESTDPLADLDAFIDLHQARWGDDGLFPATAGGAQSRVLFRRLFELFGPDGAFRLSFLTVGDRRIAAGITFETSDRVFYYNAGVDPAARDLSPDVVLVERYIRRAIERGQTAIDFLRGDEPYKYEWGSINEPVQRLLVRREVGR